MGQRKITGGIKFTPTLAFLWLMKENYKKDHESIEIEVWKQKSYRNRNRIEIVQYRNIFQYELLKNIYYANNTNKNMSGQDRQKKI